MQTIEDAARESVDFFRRQIGIDEISDEDVGVLHLGEFLIEGGDDLFADTIPQFWALGWWTEFWKLRSQTGYMRRCSDKVRVDGEVKLRLACVWAAMLNSAARVISGPTGTGNIERHRELHMIILLYIVDKCCISIENG